MITLAFLGRWLKLAGITGAALLAEWLLLRDPWLLTSVIAITLVVFVLISTALYSEWRHQRTSSGGYVYQIVRHTDRD